MIKNVAKKFSTVRMQLVFSVFVAVAPALALTYIVNQNWFWEFAPKWLQPYALDVPWASFAMGLAALVAAWLGGEHFILRQVRIISSTAQKLAMGDLTARTGLQNKEGELGQLARVFDVMAESLQQRIRERENAERILFNRALQQSAIAALGQFALTKNDLPSLLTQITLIITQTLELPLCAIWEQLPDGQLLLNTGAGWSGDGAGRIKIPAEPRSQISDTLNSGEVLIVPDLREETRWVPPILREHSVVSGITVAIPTRGRPFGVLAAYATQARSFTPDEVQFLMAAATVAGMAVERKRSDAQLQKLAAFAELDPVAAMELNEDGMVNYFNEAARRLTLAVKRSPADLLPENVLDIIRECLATGQSKLRWQTQAEGFVLSWSFHPVLPNRVLHVYVEDITERLNLEHQLRQSQKMESIGQLAAGVAHDFNNMLTIIQGHSSTLLAKPGSPPEMHRSLQAVCFAAERAANLTRQLLMFSRKNVMQVKPLDLRDVVGDMGKMLQRLLGETIALEFHPPAELPLIQGDPGMIEQVIMNLLVNARDAMPRGGTLTISVEATHIDSTYLQALPEARAGHFVRLRVTDSGCGMDDATRARIFEPFFTTKEIGKGTGLGLATVYGIVKQHGGWIEVISEPRKGSTFDVFFPIAEKIERPLELNPAPPPVPVNGTETILVVEDEPVLRDMARCILQDCGYQILEAGSGREALTVWQRRAGEIDLLLTDMVMPEGVSGVDLAEQLLLHRPQLKIIFTSGYTANEISAETLAKTRARFLQKPYSHNDLTKTVRDCLDKNTAPA